MLRLEVIDTVYFGTGKPFNKDGDNWVDSMFPPSPCVFCGALRTAWFAGNPSEVGKANEEDDPTREFRLKGVFLFADHTVYFPMPLDLITYEDRDSQVYLMDLQEHRLVSNCPAPMVLRPKRDKQAESVETGLLDHLAFEEYLSGSEGGFPYLRLAEFVTREPKLGIGMDDAKRVAKDKLLYRIGMIRPETVRVRGKLFDSRTLGFLLDYEGLNLPPKGFLKLGGESKAAIYEQCNDEWIRCMELQWPQQGTRFKIYLATPAKFTNGWLPRWIDPQTLTGTYRGVRLKLLTAAVGKPVSIGGFDMKAKRPKPMMRAVPAGSVYYFEILDGTHPVDVMRKFHYENISDIDCEQGFGLALAGGIRN